MGVVESVQNELRTRGYAIFSQTSGDVNISPGASLMAHFGDKLRDDPRGPGKLHARDVIEYKRPQGIDQAATVLSEAHSVAFTTESGEQIDDFSRFLLLDHPHGPELMAFFLSLIPQELRYSSGRVSADYFRYGASVGTGLHRDKFGDFVIIWVLGRYGHGGENVLVRDGVTVLDRTLWPGEILIFRDDRFLHAVKPMHGEQCWRDVLIFITLRG